MHTRRTDRLTSAPHLRVRIFFAKNALPALPNDRLESGESFIANSPSFPTFLLTSERTRQNGADLHLTLFLQTFRMTWARTRQNDEHRKSAYLRCARQKRQKKYESVCSRFIENEKEERKHQGKGFYTHGLTPSSRIAFATLFRCSSCYSVKRR